ncbi:cytochrome b6f subunit family protein [Prochlorococcus marinus]|uniref:Uncharacterized protein n=1 Tax=Prochlorococcus marinus XMU1408 TaxID=2213228 RepID=A0A318R2E3_PROMR|nr:cytochrome b6f subunit family protein [Prochlorococcus marinus]MBW3041870.1 hypothetical protein [Prochlorococcus marinus str. XMU1408]PYE03005.1 hypothetical protein DNJ73_04465 [Prochlorococcus marinus XMU1408]
MDFNPLIPIGTTIKVDKSKIENVIPEKLFDNLPQIIIGNIIDYKMTDGMGIGYVLITNNNQKVWIFSNELDAKTKEAYKVDFIDESSKSKSAEHILGIIKVNYKIDGNRDIKTITNPLNIFNWLIFTLKDIF